MPQRRQALLALLGTLAASRAPAQTGAAMPRIAVLTV
jgi:hypothetical protein